MYKKTTNSSFLTDSINRDPDIKKFDSESDVIIYPNPTNGQVKIHSPVIGISSIQIANIKGKSIYNEKYCSQQNAAIDLSKHPAGIYILKLKGSQNTVSTHKIIKIK